MTETQTLEALLRRWAELEPDWAKHAQALIPKPDDYSVGAWAHAGKFCIVPIQEAIEARGWSYASGYKGEGTGGMIHFGRVMIDEHYADTPTAALLSAYLQALEAQA